MATIYTDHQQWHAGELAMHRLMSAPTDVNPTSPYLVPSAAHKLMSSPLLAIGTLDSRKRPWTSIWGGAPGFARAMRIQSGDGESKSAMGVRCLIDGQWDPVLKALGGEREAGTPQGKGRKVSGLTINLEQRVRAKLAGTVVGIVADGSRNEGESKGVKEVQMVVQVDSSLGNCPKYLNMKTIRAAVPEPEVVPSTTQLPEEALDLIDSADCFFLTSSNVGETLSTNYRGGPKGFIRVLPPSAVVPDSSTSNSIELLENDPENTTQLPLIRLIYPEYSGNRLYQTLGNLYTTPQAGIAIPDLLTGTVLYATCTTQIVAGLTASSLLPRSNLAVILTMTEYYLVRNSLGFRATASENGMSPYNPPVRYLSSEHTAAGSSLRPKQHNNPQAIATIVGKEMLGPGRARVTFETDNPVHWTPGQYVALSFAGELDTGYSHMRDDDPQSLNEDWVRTFTVTSPAPREPADSTTKESGEAHAPTDAGPTAKRFEVTVRNVGPCTGLLVKSNPRAGTELAVLGFGGSFDIRAKKGETVLFVAGGVGITPLLGQIERLRRMGVGIELAWAVKKGDVEFIKGVCEAWRMTEAVDVHVFVSGGIDEAGSDALQAAGVTLVGRRLEGGDMDGFGAEKWYVCAGKSLAQAVEGWADARGAEIVGESFAY